MANKIKKYLKEVVIFSIIFIVFINIISMYKSTDLNQVPLDLNTIKLYDNSKYKIDISKPIMVHFWATWCPICKVEASNIQTISENYQVISIAVQSGSNKDIEKYMKENSVDFMVINDKDGSLAKKYNIGVFPTTVIYDKNGDIAFSDVGYTSTLGLWLKMMWTDL